MATVGEVSEIPWEFVFLWKITDFLSLSSNPGEFYNSPLFYFDNEYWYLSIYPNGGTSADARGNAINAIGLYLYRNSPGSPVNMNFTFGVKTVDDKIDSEWKCPCIFTEAEGWGNPRFLQRSLLLTSKSELLSSGDLTVICKIKYPKSTNGTILKVIKENYKESSTQTQEGNNLKEVKSKCKEENQTQGERNDGSLYQDYKKVLLEGFHHDFILRVGNREFRAHRDILRVRSTVFWSMLDLDMKEKNTNSIDISDCSPDAMEQFLLYIYCGKFETLDQSNMLGLYYIADKYDVGSLKEECKDFIKKSLSLTNICEVIQLAMNHCDSILLEKATEYFGDNMVSIMRTIEWQTFMRDNLTIANEILIKCIEKSNNTK